MLVEDAVEPASLVLVAVDPVGDFFGSVPEKVVGLPLHRANTGVLEKDPRVHIVVLAGPAGVREFVGWVVAVDKILQDGTGFKNVDGGAVGESICDSGNPPVGVDGEEPWLLLRVFGDVDGDGFVRLDKGLSSCIMWGGDY